MTTDPQSSPLSLPWFAVQVRARKEDWVAAQLTGQGFDCFLPKYKTIRQWSDRAKELEQPLFPGYLFCRFDFHNRRSLVMTPGIIQIVGSGRSPIPVEQVEIDSIRLAVSSGLPNHPWPYLEAGQRVRINYGPLSGLEGFLVNFKGSHRVVLSVTLLQRSVAMEVELNWISALADRRNAKISRTTVCPDNLVRVTG
jgi:transcription antitermination factor NusG